jgi:hypothetical protein
VCVYIYIYIYICKYLYSSTFILALAYSHNDFINISSTYIHRSLYAHTHTHTHTHTERERGHVGSASARKSFFFHTGSVLCAYTHTYIDGKQCFSFCLERLCHLLWRGRPFFFYFFFTVRECVICFGEGVNSLLLPCQHSGMCSVCAEAVYIYEVYTYMFIYMYTSRIFRMFVVCTWHLGMCSVCAEAVYIYAVYICIYLVY